MDDMDKVRQALRNRMRTNSSRFAKELHVPTTVIDDFAYNDADLPTEVLAALVKEMWDGALMLSEGELVQTPRYDAVLFAPAGGPSEYPEKPKLTKTERVPKKGPQVEKAAGWDAKRLDPLHRERRETGPLF